MKTSLIVNTACGDPVVMRKTNLYRKSTYSARATMLQRILERAVADFDEVIVAGAPPELNLEMNITICHVPPVFRNRADALWQRELGARVSTGDLLVFTHDDHIPELGFSAKLKELAEKEGDLWVPKRVHGITGEELVNGREAGYMGGHTLAMRRWVWAKVPWTKLATEWWDVAMTREWQAVGVQIVWSDSLIHYDMEASDTEA